MPATEHHRLAQRLKTSVDRERSPWPPNPFGKTCEKIASARLVGIPALAPEQDRVHLALVSFPPFDNTQIRLRKHTTLQGKADNSVDIEACGRVLVDHSAKSARQLLEMYERSLKTALEDLRADIVCFNELSFPSRNQEPMRKAVELTRQLARKHRCLIVAGSTHDRRTLYNTSCLFYPGCEPNGLPYHKQVSATSIGELVSVPAKRQAICTRVFGLNVAVLICLDLADFSAVASVVKLNEKVDVLLIPCYSEWMDSLERAARAASAALRGIVALVNYRPPSPKAPCIVEERGQTRPVDSATEIESGVIIHSAFLDPRALQQKKLEIKDRTEPWVDWLFGAQNLEPR